MSFKILFAFCAILLGTVSVAGAQIVEFRLETTDASGSVIDTINVGEQFVLSVFTKQSDFGGAPEDGGVFAGYLDVAYDGALASVSGSVEYGSIYIEGKNAELGQDGLLDNVGSFSMSTEPLGGAERQLWSLLMQANSAGELNFVGSESLKYPEYDVLVYGNNAPVDAGDIAFGSTSLTIVPEPSALALLLLGLMGCLRYFAPTRLI